MKIKNTMTILGLVLLAACGAEPSRECPTGWSAQTIQSNAGPWTCGNQAIGSFTLDLASNGTGTSDLIGPFTWAEDGCAVRITDASAQEWTLDGLAFRTLRRDGLGPQIMTWIFTNPSADSEDISCR